MRIPDSFKCYRPRENVDLRHKKAGHKETAASALPLTNQSPLRNAYNPASWSIEQRQQTFGDRSRWVDVDTKAFWFRNKYFGVYDSNNQTHGSAGMSGASAEPPCKRFGWIRLLGWFFKRNWWRFIYSSTTATVFVIIAIFGLARFAQDGTMLNMVQSVVVPKSSEDGVKRSTVESDNGKHKTYFRPKNDAEQGGAGESEKVPTVKSVLDQELTDSMSSDSSKPVRPFPVSTRTKHVVGEPKQERAKGLSEDVKQKLSGLQTDVDRLTQRLAYSSALVGISGDKIILRDGGTYRVGEQVTFGTYQGLKIEELNYPHRAVRLSNGVWLRLGAVDKVESAEPGIPNADDGEGDREGGGSIARSPTNETR